MSQGSGGPLNMKQRKDLSSSYAFLRDLCEVSTEALSQLRAKVDPDEDKKDMREVRGDDAIIIFCRPILLPDPPQRSGDGCYMPEFVKDRLESCVDMEGLAALFRHMAAICEEIRSTYGGPDAREP